MFQHWIIVTQTYQYKKIISADKWNKSVSKVIYWLDDQDSIFSIGKSFSRYHCIHIGFGVHPIFYPVDSSTAI